MIEVIKPGDAVKLNDLDAMVLQVCIQSQDRISYEVAWYSGSTRNTAWVSDFEIGKTGKSKSLKIGFQS